MPTHTSYTHPVCVDSENTPMSWQDVSVTEKHKVHWAAVCLRRRKQAFLESAMKEQCEVWHALFGSPTHTTAACSALLCSALQLFRGTCVCNVCLELDTLATVKLRRTKESGRRLVWKDCKVLRCEVNLLNEGHFN